jgi:hypothetical protein
MSSPPSNVPKTESRTITYSDIGETKAINPSPPLSSESMENTLNPSPQDTGSGTVRASETSSSSLVEMPSQTSSGSVSIDTQSPSGAIQPIQVEVNLSSSDSNSPFSGVVELPNSPEGEVGSLTVPPNLSNEPNTTLTVSYVNIAPTDFPNQQLASTILNITLVNAEGQVITQLDAPLTICLSPPNITKGSERLCLSFYDERKQKWRCEDRCLASSRNDGQLCGQTGHLTNFALLLSGSGVDPCGVANQSNTISWVSMGMVAGALIFILLGILAIEVKIRIRRYKQERSFSSIEMRTIQVL